MPIGKQRKVNAALTILPYRSGMDTTGWRERFDQAAAALLHLLFAALCLAFAQPVMAQSVNTYVVTNDGRIDRNRTCTNPLVRNFNVTDSFTVTDVDIGVLVTHTWRGDLQITLVSPDGTRVQLTNGDTQSTSGDNFNVVLDDAAPQLVNTDSPTGNHAGTAPPFQNRFRPRNGLSAFNGQNSAGIWRLEMCDLFPGADDGNFRHAELYLTSLPANFADLSLTKQLVGSPPVSGGVATWRLTVTNSTASSAAAEDIAVRDTLPAGFSFSAATGTGSFDAATGVWDVGALDPGESAAITLSGTITSGAGTTVTNTAEIISSSVIDTDSTPNNGNTDEDDFAVAALIVQSGRAPGVAPALNCPAGFAVFDWDSISGWSPGSTDNTYAFASFGNIRFQIDNDGVFLNNAAFGGQSPTVFDALTGGFSAPENSLTLLADQPNRTGDVELVITLPRVFAGVQFSIFDVDFFAGQFTDRVEVFGTRDGATVLPVLTNGNVNQVSGNIAIGDGLSADPEPLGNVVVTFTEGVDRIVVRYGNHSNAPANPGQQAISLHDLTFCNPFTSLAVTKVSTLISDPVNGTTNPKAIPGALVEYLITVANTGTSATDADSVVVWDQGPADARLCLLGRTGGPIIWNDPGGVSGLVYGFSGLGSASDDLEFSSDGGSSWNYTPVADAAGCDPAITDFRLRPRGAFAGGGSVAITVRYIVN